MAIPLQGYDKADILWGLITLIEIRQQATGDFLKVGRFQNASLDAEVLAKPGDPAGTMYAYALRYTLSFDVLQTAKAAELAAFIAGTAATGLLETDVEVRLTFAGGRTITLGAVSGSPLRLIPVYHGANEDGAQYISVAGTNIEAMTTLAAKVA
jgi:hypothetical protein